MLIGFFSADVYVPDKRSFKDLQSFLFVDPFQSFHGPVYRSVHRSFLNLPIVPFQVLPNLSITSITSAVLNAFWPVL